MGPGAIILIGPIIFFIFLTIAILAILVTTIIIVPFIIR